MILLDLKRYVREQGQVSDQQLMNRFQLTASALEGLLAPLIQQGHIYASPGRCQMGGCQSCQHTGHVYQWRDRRYRPFSLPVIHQSG